MSIKILLADDSITIQKVIGIIFGSEEYNLTVVDNGKAALDKARDVAPDVLLIDALMPGMSGYEVCEAIRATPALAQKPILLLTGSFEPFDEVRAKSCGADDFLAKPFESQQIVTKVKELSALGASRAVSAPRPVSPAAMPSEAAPMGGSGLGISTDDIWGAFTPASGPASADISHPTMPGPALEPDVFGIINEKPLEQIPQPPSAPPTVPGTTGSSWIPVEEHTFDFAEATATAPTAAFSEPVPTRRVDTFGEISFGEESASVAPEPVSFFEAPPAPTEPIPPAYAAGSFDEPTAPPVSVAAETAPVVLTEEQLRAAIAAVSKDVIERIVWEVVPDLAEALIKEAIRKIKEGV